VGPAGIVQANVFLECSLAGELDLTASFWARVNVTVFDLFGPDLRGDPYIFFLNIFFLNPKIRQLSKGT
jgi:hypothetical protein